MDFEKLGLFYLGRPYDPARKAPRNVPLLYDSKDLVTHALCVGMTGSGKTGLCIGLLEEAAIDKIPAVVIDPKGDVSNLLLTFPDLKPEDFLPWINPADAEQHGLSTAQYAEQQAALWKKGLAESGQSGERIRRMRDSAEFRIYTPGSSAGIPVSIVRSFSPPKTATDPESTAEQIGTIATSLLALMKIEADPIQSREHILISTILARAWQAGRGLELSEMIQQIQKPPVERVGVLDLESFFPSQERFGLAMRLNNLLAAPGFESWMQGDPLDIDSILYRADGKPRVSIFSIAHLGDAERMFFVSLMLNQIVGWMRAQQGTSSLRALVYMDEIFGYFPPVANPPSKTPLLTLLKQARAFGLGIVLATQNPVDLDYRGLANVGTWFIGRLQTERDKARLLEGLEGSTTGPGRFARKEMEEMLAGLGNRVFLMRNVHEKEPQIFQTRWTLSYLRGPLTRAQIKALMSAQPVPSPVENKSEDTAQRAVIPEKTAAIRSGAPAGPTSRPVLPPEIQEYFLRPGTQRPGDASLLYRPMLLGIADVYFADAKSGTDETRRLSYLSEIPDSPATAWHEMTATQLQESELERSPQADGAFQPLPAAASQAKNYAAWQRLFADNLYRGARIELFRSSRFSQFSKAGESEREFRLRLQQAAREQRDEALEKMRQKYAPRIAMLQQRLQRAQQAVTRETEQSKQQKMQTAISFGATLLGAVMGRKTLGTSTLGRATTAARGISRSMKETEDVERAEKSVQDIQAQLEDLELQLRAESDAQAAAIDASTDTLEKISLKPRKTNITVQTVALVWLPFWQQSSGVLQLAWKE